MFHQIFLSPQVKRRAIIHSTYELPHELPNNLKRKNPGKYQNLLELYTSAKSSSSKIDFFLILAKNFREIEIRIFPQGAFFQNSS